MKQYEEYADHAGKQSPTRHSAYGCNVLMSTHSLTEIMLHVATILVYNVYCKYSEHISVDPPAIVPSMVHCLLCESLQVMGPVPLA